MDEQTSPHDTPATRLSSALAALRPSRKRRVKPGYKAYCMSLTMFTMHRPSIHITQPYSAHSMW